ncbi:MAG: hypothetical protein QXX55_01120 [Candidatus Pacearchaeota archaeon]
MSKELSNLIKEINSIKNFSDRKGIMIKNFLKRFEKGVMDEPERIGDFINSLDKLIKKSLPYKDASSRQSFILRNLFEYGFIIDNNLYGVNFDDILFSNEFLINYLIKPLAYGSITRTLSDFLGLEGVSLLIKIYRPYDLN